MNILFKIINSINFHFSKIYEFFRYELFVKKVNYLDKQNSIFLKYNLNREEGLKKLNRLLSNNKNIISDMQSEHSIIFSSLSSLKNKSFVNILEIGTYDGKNAVLLSKLFEKSNIETLDLPDDDQNFLNSYERKDSIKRKIFCKNRDILIKSANNIKFIKMNSLQLVNSSRKYDLIWIDGAHGYPYSTIDIINSLKLINHGGIILCDDVYKKTKKNDQFYISTSTHETLIALEKAKVINFGLFYKRLNKKINSNPYNKKYVGIIELVDL